MNHFSIKYSRIFNFAINFQSNRRLSIKKPNGKIFEFSINVNRVNREKKNDDVVEKQNITKGFRYIQNVNLLVSRVLKKTNRGSKKKNWRKQTTFHLFHLTCNEWIQAQKESESLDGENSNTLTHVIYNMRMLNAQLDGSYFDRVVCLLLLLAKMHLCECVSLLR